MPPAYWLEPRHAWDGIEFQVFPEGPFIREGRAAIGGESGRGEGRLLDEGSGRLSRGVCLSCRVHLPWSGRQIVWLRHQARCCLPD